MRIAVAAAVFAIAPLVVAGGGDATPVRTGVSRPELRVHLNALQRIADRHGANRAAGTSGYAASVDYVVRTLRAASVAAHRDRFTLRLFRELAPPRLAVVRPRAQTLRRGRDFLTLSYSGAGMVTGRLQPVDLRLPPGRANSSTSACERSDFRPFRRGRIALVQRGRCRFGVKAQNAQAAGARAVLIFNEGQPGRREVIEATLGDRSGIRIPVLALSYSAGRSLVQASRRGPAVVRVAVRARTRQEASTNVIAEIPGRSRDRVVMLGAHLDSVRAGPGINDNGSGTALVLAVGRELARTRTEATIRLAFWGAEELGLLGSSHYVEDQARTERDRLAVYLNFDMVASPNYARLVYGGQSVPQRVEQAFRSAFERLGLRTAETSLGGASDHAPFARAGIPVGGIFTGAGELKSPARAREFGGRAGRPYDPCYHRACDRLANANLAMLGQASDAALEATLELAGQAG